MNININNNVYFNNINNLILLKNNESIILDNNKITKDERYGIYFRKTENIKKINDIIKKSFISILNNIIFDIDKLYKINHTKKLKILNIKEKCINLLNFIDEGKKALVRLIKYYKYYNIKNYKLLIETKKYICKVSLKQKDRLNKFTLPKNKTKIKNTTDNTDNTIDKDNTLSFISNLFYLSKDSVSNSIEDSVSNSIEDSISNSIEDSIEDSISNSIEDSIEDSNNDYNSNNFLNPDYVSDKEEDIIYDKNNYIINQPLLIDYENINKEDKINNNLNDEFKNIELTENNYNHEIGYYYFNNNIISQNENCENNKYNKHDFCLNIDDDYLDNCNKNDKTCYTIPVFCSINDFYINIKNYLIQKYQIIRNKINLIFN